METNIEQNAKAILEFEETYGPIEVAMSKDPHHISYLRLLGLVCSTCGKNEIYVPNLKFFKYGPDVQCYKCQGLNR